MIQEKIIKSTCGMCFAGCGVQVHVKDGKVVVVKGDPQSPVNYGVLCPKGRAAPELLYHPDRLQHPLRRTGQRGGGQWTRISWNEALDTIAGEFIKTRDEDGPERVAFIQGSAKGLIDNYNERLANAFGTPNFSTTGHICFLPRFFASRITCGSYTVADYEHPPACIVVWGANLAETRIGEHHRAVRQLGRGTQLVVVDPMPSIMARKSHIWLRLRPGTDLALALGLIHVIINEQLYDRSFVRQHTIGFRRLKEHIQQYSPRKVSEITWIPTTVIEKAARFYATTAPACIQWGNAVDHGVNSFQTCRALSILKALTGNLDVPGGDVLPSYPLAGAGAVEISMRSRLAEQTWEKRAGAGHKRLPLYRRVPPTDLVNAMLAEDPYRIKSVYVHASNPLLTYTHASRTYQAFRRLNFLAVADFFMTPTAALADIVLPAATFLEFDNVVAPPYYPYAQIQQQAVAPVGECRSDLDITRELAVRLGLGDLFWDNSQSLLDTVLKPIGLTFEQFRDKGLAAGAIEYRKCEKQGFATPSGKVELYSRQLASWGFDPLPVYHEPPGTPASDPQLAKAYPLVLTTRKSVYYLHSCGRQIKSLRRGHPQPQVFIHPETAARLGIEADRWVYIETRRGRIKQKAVFSGRLDPRVVCVDFGWWFPENKADVLSGWAQSNLNVLTDDQSPLSPEIGSDNLRGLCCRVYPVEKNAGSSDFKI